jgi:hypothetical protein
MRARREQGWISRRDREPVNIAGRLVLAGGRCVHVQVLDMSPEGCRVECEETLPIGVTASLYVGEGIATAQVRWAVGRAAGLRLI